MGIAIHEDGTTQEGPAYERLLDAKADADHLARPSSDAQVMLLSPVRRVVAAREAGGAWHPN
jgi:hypothetical protein